MGGVEARDDGGGRGGSATAAGTREGGLGVARGVGSGDGHGGGVESVGGFLLNFFEVCFQRFVEEFGFLEIHVGGGELFLEGFEAALEVLVGDS